MTSIKFKDGIKLSDLKPQTVLALMLCWQIYRDQFTAEMVVTSINDGRHMDGSKHYTGEAFDLRTKGTGRGSQIANEARRLLGPLGFDVLFEDQHGVNEHLHIEYDPK
jgi:hypothetical protein